MQKTGIVYVAGKMRGVPRFNFPAFDLAARRLREAGHTVISPAEMDRENGFDEASTEPPKLRDCIRRDLTAITDFCDTIALLPGWERSAGCAVEVALGKFLGLRFLDAVTLKEIAL